MRKWIVIAAVAAVVSPAYAAKPCLRLDDIQNWTVPNDSTVVVENFRHQKFTLSLMGTCQGIRFREKLGFKTVGGSRLTCLSPGDYVIQRGGPATQHRCPISKIEMAAPEKTGGAKAKP